MTGAGTGATPADPPVMHRVERMCLALPGVAVRISHGAPAYQVGGKGFAYTWNNHHGDGRIALWVRGRPGAQQEWLTTDPTRYYRPPYVGPSGWVGAWLDGEVDWPAVTELLVEGYLDRIGPRKEALHVPEDLFAQLISA